jgi:hypothetical protein
MNIHKLVNNEQEYRDFCYKLFDYATGNEEIWRAEDLPKMQPFFDYQAKKRTDPFFPFTPEALAAYIHYEKCLREYGRAEARMRDSVSNISIDKLMEAFGFEEPEYDEDNEPDFYEYEKFTLNEEFFEGLSFPMVIVADIDSDCDRAGKFQIIDVDFVCKSEFD